MNKFDFLSEATKNFIFERILNKTNIGGEFTLIYLLIVLLIIFTYMYDYSITPQYSYQHSYEHQYKDDNESFINRYNDENLNPDITFNIRIINKDTNSNNFQILYFDYSNDGRVENNHIIEPGKDYTKKLYDINFAVLYKCDDEYDNEEKNCPINKEEIENLLYGF